MERDDEVLLIYLDAGHGGRDSGASANGIHEKDIVLKIQKKMENLLKNYENVRVETSRDTDVFLSLAERTNKANRLNADVLISLHVNGFTDTRVRGFETFRFTNANARSTAFQNVMHDEIMKAMGTGITDRGRKSQNFHMLRESKMTSILTEVLFITNTSDANLLKQDVFLDKVAVGHVNGLEKFLGLKRKIERPPRQGLWKVQVGAFEQESNARAMESDLRKQGYRPFVFFE
jgi:N-acetylmuramoyl-L-alanine amidase